MKHPRATKTLLLLVAVFSVQCSVFSQAAVPVLTAAPDPVATWIGGMAADHPWLTTLAAFMGFLRLAFKPLMGLVHNFVANTATRDDDDVLTRVEGSLWFQVFAYALDWTASIKLTKPATFVTTRLLSLSILFLLSSSLLLGTGCASIHQSATSSVAPDGTETRTVTARVLALGDAKQAVEKLNTASGKTVTAGATGASQETTSESLKTLLEFIKALGAAVK